MLLSVITPDYKARTKASREAARTGCHPGGGGRDGIMESDMVRVIEETA